VSAAAASRPAPAAPSPAVGAFAPPADVPLGERVSVTRAGPGRYAAAIRYRQESQCSQSWAVYQARTTFVLELEAGGTARACRGRHALSQGGGWRSGTRDPPRALDEQQGYAGRWRPDGPWIEVDLPLSDQPCPQIRGYLNRAPDPWRLRCLALVPDRHPLLPGPVLACRFAARVYTEELGYAIPGLLPGEWLVLGAGPGLRLEREELPYVGAGERTVVRAAEPPVEIGEWREARGR
jgi:hypothetical protein